MSEGREFAGVYVDTWEAPRLVVEAGRRFFGLWVRRQRLLVTFPGTFELPPRRNAEDPRRGPARFFNLRVRGSLGPKGAYGHMGACEHELQVDEVLECTETTTPSFIW